MLSPGSAFDGATASTHFLPSALTLVWGAEATLERGTVRGSHARARAEGEGAGVQSIEDSERVRGSPQARSRWEAF